MQMGEADSLKNGAEHMCTRVKVGHTDKCGGGTFFIICAVQKGQEYNIAVPGRQRFHFPVNFTVQCFFINIRILCSRNKMLYEPFQIAG